MERRLIFQNSRLAVYILAVAIPATLICGVIYAVAQQSLRLGANDPQIQLAEDAATALGESSLPEEVVSDQTVDAAKSLAPFIMIYGNDGKPVISDATFGGKDLTVPAGVLEDAKLHGQSRVTWQPTPGLRFAAVAVRSGGNYDGYVVAARSLREVEVRESDVLNIAAAGWLILLAVGGAAVGWLIRIPKTKKST